jgi:branched-chain amino acid aminotransferase
MRTSSVEHIERTANPSAKPKGADLGFGRFFTDHVLLADHSAAKGWHNARIVPRAAVPMDLGAGALHYGLSIFEGLKAHRGLDGQLRIFRPDAHARRFAESAKRLCLPPVDETDFVQWTRAIVHTDADWYPDPATVPGGTLYIRPLLFASESFLGVRAATEHTLAIMISPVGNYFSSKAKGLRLWIEREHVRASKGGLGAVKTGGNYAASLFAAKRAQEKGYDQVLWMDSEEHRFLEEAGTMNVFVRIGDRVVTPPLGGSILAGVTRDSCLTLLRSWGVPTEERKVSIDELAVAHERGELHEVFGTGTAAVIAPIDQLAYENGHLDTPGREIATRLKTALDDIFVGRATDVRGWMVPVEDEDAVMNTSVSSSPAPSDRVSPAL